MQAKRVYTGCMNTTTKQYFEMALLVLTIGYTFFLSHKLVVAEKKASYLAGQMSVYESFAQDGTEGTKYTK